MSNNILRSVVAKYDLEKDFEIVMEKKDSTTGINKVTEALIKELEGLNEEGLHEFFMFFYKMNHQHAYMVTPDGFEDFLEAFELNPFKVNDDKKFRKQLIDNVIKYAYDHMALLTAAILIKKKFTMAELIDNYYANLDVFGGNWY